MLLTRRRPDGATVQAAWGQRGHHRVERQRGDIPLIDVLPRLYALEGIDEAQPHVLGTACMHGQLGHGWLFSRCTPAGIVSGFAKRPNLANQPGRGYAAPVILAVRRPKPSHS